MDAITAKSIRIDEIRDCIEAISDRELMVRIKVLKDKTTTVGGFERGDNSMGYVSQIEEHIQSLDNVQHAIGHMV